MNEKVKFSGDVLKSTCIPLLMYMVDIGKSNKAILFQINSLFSNCRSPDKMTSLFVDFKYK